MVPVKCLSPLLELLFILNPCERNRITRYNKTMNIYNDSNDPIIESPVNNDDLTGIHREWHIGKFNHRNKNACSTDLYVRLQLRNLEKDNLKPARFVVNVMFEEFYAGWPGGWCSLVVLDKIGWELKYSKDFNHELFNELMEIAKKYDSNNLHAGTRKQDECLKQFYPGFYGDYDFNTACKVLEEHNLLIDRGFKYGSKWLFREIPDADLARISDLIVLGN